jgi:hypothetical protein
MRPSGVFVPQEPDLFKDDIKIIAGVDDEKEHLVLLEYVRRPIIST